MIIIELTGGLGNQIAQYAYALLLKESREDIVLFRNFEYLTESHEYYHLDKIINVEIPFISTLPNNLEIFHFFDTNNFIFRVIRKFFFKDILFFRNLTFNMHKKLLLKEKNLLVKGFFYSKYESSTVQQRLRSNLLEISSDFEIQNNDCFIHIRRGDTLNKSVLDIRNSLDTKYYFEAMSIMEKNYEVNKFYFFSDDINWVKDNFKSEKFIFIENFSDFNSFLLMTKFNNAIVANSTMSQWGSYLSKFKNIVITPEKVAVKFFNNMYERKVNKILLNANASKIIEL